MALGIVSIILWISVQLLVEVRGQQTTDVTYDEIRMMNATCELDHSCDGRQHHWDNLGASKCVCGSDCVRYGTCCVDSPHRVHSAKIPPVECVSHAFSMVPHFMVTKCSNEWRGRRYVIEMCQHDFGKQPPRDPYAAIPVVDTKSDIHYKNYFCGLCNGVDDRDLVLWNVTVTVVEDGSGQTYDQNTLLDKLYYDNSRKMWGFMRNINGKPDFVKVKINVFYPENSAFCLSNLISDCGPSWTDQTVRDKCKAYMAVISYHPKSGPDGEKRFRNVHCAICNNVDLENGYFSCFRMSEPLVDQQLSFSMPVDVNQRSVAVAGRTSSCRPGESFDTFAKKCRALGCGLPGKWFIVRNKCVRG